MLRELSVLMFVAPQRAFSKHTNVEQVVTIGYFKSVLITFLVDKGNFALFAGLGRIEVAMQQSRRRREGSP